MWCFGHFLLTHSSGKIDKRWVLLLDDLTRVGEYDWGLASLGNTYEYLDDWSTIGTNLVGMVVVLEYWYYYYFRNMQPLLCQTPGGYYDVFPNICLFKKIRIASRKREHRNGQKDTMKHSVKSSRTQIDTRTRETCIWQPWTESQYAAGDQYEYALEVSKKRFLFVHFEKRTRVSCYLAERFQRQITGDIVVPANPPNLETIDENDIVVEVNDYYTVTEDQYNTRWTKKSVGPYVTESYHAQNVDEIAVGSSVVPRRLFPGHPPPDMMSQTYTYDTHNYPPSRLPEIDFSLPFSNETGVERQVPVPMVPCPYNFLQMNLTMEDCIRWMEKSCSYQLGSRQAAWDESYKSATTSCSSSGRSTSSSVPYIHPPNNPNEAFTSQGLTLGGSYEWATGQGFYTPRVEDGATTSQQGNAQYQQGGNEFTDALLGSEPNIVYDTQFNQEPHNFL
ncbi:uncharacterized protein LOC113316982 [Papaver somniferum]|uniref:uncharacterized protein LOC113316982 n=1 Tax=Papaver somniferum TaxID=3469 RepID=UPI000E6FF645|nr:uncharacterized protein LOC113316982 [Papaver somniferum]XP_026420924.1 uncharacterized protein LOC113316982 [Papaver somniferum]